MPKKLKSKKRHKVLKVTPKVREYETATAPVPQIPPSAPRVSPVTPTHKPLGSRKRRKPWPSTKG